MRGVWWVGSFRGAMFIIYVPVFSYAGDSRLMTCSGCMDCFVG